MMLDHQETKTVTDAMTAYRCEYKPTRCSVCPKQQASYFTVNLIRAEIHWKPLEKKRNFVYYKTKYRCVTLV